MELRYPFELVPGDPEFDFPAAEGVHPHCQSDTWFLAGELSAASGRRFAFLNIFNQNRPGGDLVADFHTLAFFDLDNGTGSASVGGTPDNAVDINDLLFFLARFEAGC